MFHHLLQREGDAYLSRSLICFETRERLDAFLGALQAVIDRHDILRSAACWDGLSQPVQVVYRQALLPMEELTLSQEADARQQLLERTDPRHVRLDLQRAPLLAAYVAVDSHRGEWLLSLLNHHLVCDHLTLERLVGEVQAICRGSLRALAPPYRTVTSSPRR